MKKIATLACMDVWIHHLLAWLSLPEFGLSTVFVVAFVSATLLPLGSEPAVLGLIHLNPGLFWPTIVVGTVGNTLGGMLTWWMGRGAESATTKWRDSTHHMRALQWVQKLGPKACLLSWLPLVGDPLCAVAGWLQLPFWSCTVYMAIGKFLRYLSLTAVFNWVVPRLL